MLLPFAQVPKAYGPEPIGVVARAVAAGSMMMPGFDVIWNSQLLDGCLSVTLTVVGSTASRRSITAWTFAIVGDGAVRSRSMLATTALASTGVPLANFAPPSMLKVYVSPSVVTSHLVASRGRIFPSESSFTRVSYTL